MCRGFFVPLRLLLTNIFVKKTTCVKQKKAHSRISKITHLNRGLSKRLPPSNLFLLFNFYAQRNRTTAQRRHRPPGKNPTGRAQPHFFPRPVVGSEHPGGHYRVRTDDSHPCGWAFSKVTCWRKKQSSYRKKNAALVS
jgi:hypothetical protein